MVGPPLIALLAVAKSEGVTDPAALEQAQLARHIAAGHGFPTSTLRPLAVALEPQEPQVAGRSQAAGRTNEGADRRHPDRVNPPLYPWLLAAAFRLGGASEPVVIAVGVSFWLLIVWLLFWIGRYWWDWRVAGVATAFCACHVAGWKAATTGLSEPLMALWVLAAVAAVFPKPEKARGGDVRLAIWQAVLAGVFCGLAALTDYRLLPLALVIGLYLAKTQGQAAGVVWLFVGAVMLTLLPWWIRNLTVGGGLFGLYGYGALENTRLFPGQSIWRLTTAPQHPLFHLLGHPSELARKLALGLAHYRTETLHVLEPVAMLLCAFALFGAPANSSRRRLAVIVTSSAALTVLLSCLTRPDARLLLAWTPLLSGVAAAQLVAWTQANVGAFSTRNARLRVSASGARALLYAGVLLLVAFPPLIQLGRSVAPNRQDTSATVAILRQHLPQKGLLLTDAPAFVAWHLNRPALWLSQQETDWLLLEKRLGPVAGIYFSPQLARWSPHEMADWWMWMASPRGVYRGTAAVVNHPRHELLRLPQTPLVASSPTDGLDRWEQIVRHNPQSAEAHAQVAFAYLALGRLREAHHEFQEASRLDPYHVESLIGLWQTMAQLTHSDGTLRLSQLATQCHPQDPRSKPLLEQAAAHFEQLTAQRPDDPWLLLNLILCRSRLGQWKTVETCYGQLGKLLPQAFPPRLLLANLYLQQGETEKAAAECEPLLREHPDMPTAHYLAGRIAFAQNRWEAALGEFLSAVKLRPNWLAGHLQAARICQQLKRYADAAQHFCEAVQLAPNQGLLHYQLAQTLLAQRRTQEAEESLRRALECALPPREKRDAVETLGALHPSPAP